MPQELLIKSIKKIIIDSKADIIAVPRINIHPGATDEFISTMSYSTVKKYGYPDLGKYQMAYHIVREADLLSAYDLDRCLIYSIVNEKLDYENAIKRVIDVTKNRMLTYRSDRLFITNYSKALSFKLHKKASSKLKTFEDIVEKLYLALEIIFFQLMIQFKMSYLKLKK